MSSHPFGHGSPKSFISYPRGDFDIESGHSRKTRRQRSSPLNSIFGFKSIGTRIYHFYKLHPVAVFFMSLSFGVIILIVLSVYESQFRIMGFRRIDELSLSSDSYPFANLRNLVMVAGHSIYTSSSCGRPDSEDSWFLEPHQKNPGRAATFLAHIRKGVELAGKDDNALLLFSGGETRKNAGPRTEAQSYWGVAESEGWFGKQDNVKIRALTEEHARDSFENLLFSVCRFREITGAYPQNITVVSYDYKEPRFSHLHREAIGFPEERFFYSGTPAPPSAKEAAEQAEASARAQFQEDPYGCLGALQLKRIKRDPFHRSIPYPNGCPELKGLLSYCGPLPFPGSLPWV